jgi:hypothetical protein
MQHRDSYEAVGAVSAVAADLALPANLRPPAQGRQLPLDAI